MSYWVARGASSKTGDGWKARLILFDSPGHRNSVKQEAGICVTWECSVRRKSHCGATVREKNGFTANGAAHSHPPDAMAQVSRVAPRAMREAGESKPDKSGSAVAWRVTGEYLETNPDLDPSQLPNTETLRRKTHKFPGAGRPPEPRDLDFDIDSSSIPGRFFRGDVQVSGGRSLLFATEKQLVLLEAARTWYGDGTFKLVGRPFKQLYVLHAFVTGETGCLSQVHPVFVLMSHRRENDYFAAITGVKDLVPRAAVRTSVMDFELANWLAVNEVFSRAKRRGCFFHSRQCLYCEIQKLGFSKVHKNDPDKRRFMRSLMALPLLPAADAPKGLDSLVALTLTCRCNLSSHTSAGPCFPTLQLARTRGRYLGGL